MNKGIHVSTNTTSDPNSNSSSILSTGSDDVGYSTEEVSDSVNVTISVVVSNDGDVSGDEVVFAFFRPVSTGATGPAILLNDQLFDYKRVSLEPTESTRVDFTVDESGNLVSYPGSYEIIVSNGASEHLTFSVAVDGKKKVVQDCVQPFPESGKSGTSVSSAGKVSQGRGAVLGIFLMLLAQSSLL